jgi:hypothetical protein
MWYESGEKSIDPDWLADNDYPLLKRENGVLNWDDVMLRLREL